MCVDCCAGKSKKGKSKSAFREEFDRQSEEEEAAERAAMSTPGFSDNGMLTIRLGKVAVHMVM